MTFKRFEVFVSVIGLEAFDFPSYETPSVGVFCSTDRRKDERQLEA